MRKMWDEDMMGISDRDQPLTQEEMLAARKTEVEFFEGKLLSSALKPLRVWHVNPKKRERMLLHTTLLTKSGPAFDTRRNACSTENVRDKMLYWCKRLAHHTFHLATLSKWNFLRESFCLPRSNHCECDMSTQKKRENAAPHDLVDKVFVNSVGRV